MADDTIYKHCMYCNMVQWPDSNHLIDKCVLISMLPDVNYTSSVCDSDLCMMTYAASGDKSDSEIDEILLEEYCIEKRLKPRFDAWVECLDLLADKESKD